MRKGAPLAVVAIARALVVAAMIGWKDSNAGSASAAPNPLRKVRRDICGFSMTFLKYDNSLRCLSGKMLDDHFNREWTRILTILLIRWKIYGCQK
jgi:hypothetical protein